MRFTSLLGPLIIVATVSSADSIAPPPHLDLCNIGKQYLGKQVWVEGILQIKDRRTIMIAPEKCANKLTVNVEYDSHILCDGLYVWKWQEIQVFTQATKQLRAKVVVWATVRDSKRHEKNAFDLSILCTQEFEIVNETPNNSFNRTPARAAG